MPTTTTNKLSQKGKCVNSFFAGIGGFDLAFERNGFIPTFQCEKDDFCRSVLKRHWPDVPSANDIRDLAAKDVPDAEVWAAGFPCQDLSLARTPHGRMGLRGVQSGLFFRFLELLSAQRPTVVLLENVSGLLNSHQGWDFTTLINSLTSLGYAVAWRVLNARYFGLPQSRPRIFLCAWNGSPLHALRALYEDEIAATPRFERRGFEEESRCAVSGISVPHISFCISATSGRHTGLDWARSYVTYDDAVRRLTPKECERLQGFPEGWTMPHRDFVVPIRGFETNRYRAIGNAVCVPVAEWIAKKIADLLFAPPGTPAVSSRLAVLRHSANKFLSTHCEVKPLHWPARGTKWKSGGIAFNEYFTTTPVSPSPIRPMRSHLIDLIEKEQVNERYFLSSNAMKGILRRVDRMGRDLFPPLDAVLRKLAEPNACERTANSIAI
jgi:DNA (cytosine-5)-methyltransferase 1